MPGPSATTAAITPTAPTSAPTGSPPAGGGRAGPDIGQTAASIAELVKGQLIGRGDLAITGVAALDQAQSGTLSFIRSAKFANQWAASKASAALVTRGVDVPTHDPADRALIVVDNADLAMLQVLNLFAPRAHEPAGIHPTAIVDQTAVIGQGVRIGAHCVIGPRTRIGDGCVLHARVTLGADVVIGPLSTLHPGVIIYDRCTIGAKCQLHGNVVIGADGFGYVPDPQGRGLLKVPHIGTVEIGNAVEIGACSCVDRGKFGATVIGDGCKIDNLCQIGHNVRMGRACIVCGMCGIGGSVVMEDGVILAGHVGIQDGKRIGARATISAKSGVMDDVPAGEVWFGTPAGPHKDQMRSFVALRQLSKHFRDLKRAAKAIDQQRTELPKP